MKTDTKEPGKIIKNMETESFISWTLGSYTLALGLTMSLNVEHVKILARTQLLTLLHILYQR